MFFAPFDPFLLINLVSVNDNSWSSLFKLVIFSLEPVFLYIFNNSKTCDNKDSEFEIKGSMSSKIFETSVALTWDNFVVPFSSQGEFGLNSIQ